MQERSDTPATTTPAVRPWSWFGCAGVGCISYALFAVAQLVAFCFALEKIHPGWFAYVMSHPQDASVISKWTIEASTASNLFLFAVVGDGIMALVALFLAREFLHAGARELGLAGGPSANKIAIGLAMGLVLVLVSEAVAGVQTKLFGPHPEAVAQLLKSHHGGVDFLFDFLSVAVLAPFAEELLFRGVIFTGLAQRMPVIPAAIISGITFALAHLDKWNIVPLAVVGFGLALIYQRTGSLYANMAAHATFNTVALVAVYLYPQFAT